MTDLFEGFRQLYGSDDRQVLEFEAYLEACREDRMYCATAAERLLLAIGEPRLVDTSADPRLGRIFGNRTVRVFDSFDDFYGMETVIENLQLYVMHAAQGLEERKQILYLLGPVGGGKSSLAERLKALMEVHPIWVLAFERDDGRLETSPVFECPLWLFDPDRHGDEIERRWHIPRRYLEVPPSPWAVKRLREARGDLRRFRAVRMQPSRVEQIAIAKTEPGDEQNQDISSLVGKVDLRRLDELPRHDPDAYSWSGALCRGNRGIVEFVEMFKAPIKTLHPLLTATQERNYTGTEEIGAIPFEGIILAHSNETEWQAFRTNPRNEAFLDRVYVVRVPYCLRATEEAKIYRKMLRSSSLTEAPVAPGTIEMLARWTVMTRLAPPPRGTMLTKLRVYDGENVADLDPKAMTYEEYRAEAGREEGMSGMSTRFAFKVLARAFTADDEEIAADPVLLMSALRWGIAHEHLPEEKEKEYLGYLEELARDWRLELEKQLQRAYVENFDEYAQTTFENYVRYAEAWLDESSWRDPETGTVLDRQQLGAELDKLEKPAGIANPKAFRAEVVRYALREQARLGTMPRWDAYARIRDAVEKRILGNIDELLPVISFGTKRDRETAEKHEAFVRRMVETGYTPRQVQRVVEWFMRTKRS